MKGYFARVGEWRASFHYDRKQRQLRRPWWQLNKVASVINDNEPKDFDFFGIQTSSYESIKVNVNVSIGIDCYIDSGSSRYISHLLGYVKINFNDIYL